MIVTHKIPYENGELRIGWASWDDGTLTKRSIKYAYKDASGKISRGAPEIPFDVLMAMMELALSQGEIFFGEGVRTPEPTGDMATETLEREKRTLKSALMTLQKLTMDIPWGDFGSTYDKIGERYESVREELAMRVGR